jgi:hypothetical protein
MSTHNMTLNYNIAITLHVLYECETWSLPLGEEHRFWILEHAVLRRKLHNEELHILYSSANIIMTMCAEEGAMQRNIAPRGEIGIAYKTVVHWKT